MPPSTSIVLLDNGSLRPQATLNLRRLAEALSAACGVPVEAVTLGPLAERLAAEGAT